MERISKITITPAATTRTYHPTRESTAVARRKRRNISGETSNKSGVAAARGGHVWAEKSASRWGVVGDC